MEKTLFYLTWCIVFIALSDAISLNTTANFEALLQVLGPTPKEPYMQEEIYLKNWIDSHQDNISEAIINLEKYLEWRETEALSDALNENWDDMRARFPFTVETNDKEGNPVLYVDIGTWDIAACLSENTCALRLEKYMVMLTEIGQARVRKLQAEGSRATKLVFLINLGGFSILKHATPQSLMFFRRITTGKACPFYTTVNVKAVIMVNTPSLFRMAYSVFGPDTQAFVTLYDYNTEIWRNALLERISLDQFPVGIFAGIEPLTDDSSDGLLQWRKEL